MVKGSPPHVNNGAEASVDQSLDTGPWLGPHSCGCKQEPKPSPGASGPGWSVVGLTPAPSGQILLCKQRVRATLSMASGEKLGRLMQRDSQVVAVKPDLLDLKDWTSAGVPAGQGCGLQRAKRPHQHLGGRGARKQCPPPPHCRLPGPGTQGPLRSLGTQGGLESPQRVTWAGELGPLKESHFHQRKPPVFLGLILRPS